MRHLAAYLLAAISETEVPTEAKIQSILGSVGVEADEQQLKVVIEKFAGRAPSKVIAEGQLLLSSVPSVSAGTGAVPSGGKAAPAAVAAVAPAAKQEKKEEKKEEPEEESDDDMGFGLFD